VPTAAAAPALAAPQPPSALPASAAQAPARSGYSFGDDEAAVGPEGASGSPARTLRLGSESGLSVHASPEAERRRHRDAYPLEAATVEWMARHVRPGDVVYDVGAGLGGYAVLAAARRGAMVVAFEPGFSVFKALCDNLRLNGCDGSVVPLPIALGDRTGLLELEYTHTPGDERHTLRPRAWRPRRESHDEHYTQPVCAEPLEDVVRRHRLPMPNVVRVATRRGAEAVLAGAAGVLASPGLRAVLVSVADAAQAQALEPRMRAYGLAGSLLPSPHGRALLALERVSTPTGPGLGSRLLGAYRRARGLW
jgi:FkbM family methyltransferase